MRFSVCGAPLDDWANCGYVDVLFTCGECSFSSFGSWSTNSNFLPPFSFRNSEKKKKSSSLFILETKEISIYILKQRKPSNFKRRF